MPLLAGADHDTTAAAFSAVAVTEVGDTGVPIGVTRLEGCDVADPPPVVAATVNEYVVPLLSPVTVVCEALPSTVTVAPPGEAVMV